MGGVWEVCQPRSVRVCLIYVFVEGLVERLRLGQLVHLASETKADQGGHSKAARSPSRTCAGAACLIGLLGVGLEDPEEGRFGGYFTPSAGTPHPVGATAGATRNALGVFSPLQIKA